MNLRSAFASFVAPAALALLAQGCVGIYDNTEKFLSPPKQGLPEADLLATYGFPDFTTGLDGGNKVYGYKVRDVKYIVLVGLYEGYDLLVTVERGAVKGTTNIPRSKALTIFQPIPWAETE